LSNLRLQAATLLDPSLHKDGVDFFRNHFFVADQAPDVSLLQNILGAFSHFPYENISKIIKHCRENAAEDKLRFPMEVMEDHARFRLGGTCFSLTFFLQTILTHCGFSCYPVMADMRAGRNMHCALVLVLNSVTYLVDPGYLLNRPMEMNASKPRTYDSEHTGVELVYHPDRRTHDLYTFNRTQLKWRYRFVDQPVPPETFLRHWQSSFFWNSMHGLCLTKAERGRMVYIHKTHMRETTYDEKRNYNLKHKLHQTIADVFGISAELVESALAALKTNMTRERELGLWVPKGRKPFPVSTAEPLPPSLALPHGCSAGGQDETIRSSSR